MEELEKQEINNHEVRPLQHSSSAAEEFPYSRPASDPFHIQDVDSEELEQLEEVAEEEQDDQEGMEKLIQEAAVEYPPSVVDQLILDLKRDGLVNFLKDHVLGKEVSIKHMLTSLGVLLPKSLRDDDLPEMALLPILKTALSRILRRRPKLEQYNTVEDAISLIKSSKNIIVLSGAGISVSCGIPDFRSTDGIYSQLQREGLYDLDDPQDMFDKEYFLNNPSCFYSFAHSIYPSNFIPSPSHRFIKLLEDKEILRRNFTQNIDTLEQEAGITKVLQCHGSFSKAACINPKCGYTCHGSEIREAIFERRVPLCPRCNAVPNEEESKTAEQKTKKKNKKNSGWGPGGENDSDEDQVFDLPQALKAPCLKPSITFFGEPLADDFDKYLFEDRESVDLLIVMGTSLKVAPVSELVAHLPHDTPVVLINRTPILHMSMDIQLLGDADFIVQYLCHKLGWNLPPAKSKAREKESETEGKVSESSSQPPSGLESVSDWIPERVGESHAWLFPGADTEGLLLQAAVDDFEEEEEEGQDDFGPSHEEENTNENEEQFAEVLQTDSSIVPLLPPSIFPEGFGVDADDEGDGGEERDEEPSDGPPKAFKRSRVE